MRRIFLLAAAFLLSAGAASAQTTQTWSPGWDLFSEPLDFNRSYVKWSVSPTRALTVTYRLVGAKPSKLYQVGVAIFCDTFPATFGQFPVENGGGTCASITRQGVTATLKSVEFGVVTTDRRGNGSFTLAVGPITSGTYTLEFQARDGAGCNLTGSCGVCALDFQSPGPIFGDATTITVP